MNKDFGNPLLAAMPKMLSPQELAQAVQSLPPLPAAPSLEGLALLSSIFIPMDYMYALYDQLYRAIRTTYTTRTVLEGIRQTNALFRGDAGTCFATQAAAGSVLGVPGIGKTSTIRRCLDAMPQVIEHTEFEGQPFFCKQVLYLRVECPSDCSVKTLALNLVAALDRAIGSNYLHQLTALRSAAASAIAAQVKILCMTHHVGLILVDEIQNAVVTAQKNKQVKPLIKFLVELTNDTCTGVFFVGTPQAEELFTRQEHLKRRTRGIRLLPLKPDGVYRNFLKLLWRYQLTPERAELTEALANKLYDWSGGIPAYIVKIFQESQAQAFLMGRPCIDAKIMQQAINILAIKVPKTYAGGTYLSDFPPIGFQPIQPAEESCKSPAGLMAGCKKAGCKPVERKRLYAKKRGRKAAVREEQDLLAAFKAGADMLEHLARFNLLEKKERMKMELQKMIEYAKALKPEDMEWKPLYPNNMPGNGLMGYAARLELPDGSGSRYYTIRLQYKEDERGCMLEEVELYVLFERTHSGSDSFVRAFRTLDEAKARAVLQFQMVYGYAMSYLADDT